MRSTGSPTTSSRPSRLRFLTRAVESGRDLRRDLHPADREPIDEEVAAGRAGVGRAPERVTDVPAVALPPRGDPAAVDHQLAEAAVGSAELAGVVADLEMLDEGELPRAPSQAHLLQS